MRPSLIFSALIQLVGSALIIFAGYAGYQMLGRAEAESRAPKDAPLTNVDVAVAEAHTSGIAFDVDGVVVPYRRVQTAAEVAGRVVFKSDQCQSGRVVKAGDVLLRVNSRDYQLEIDRLNKEFSQAESNLTELDVEIKNSTNLTTLLAEDLEIRRRELKRFSNVDPGAFAQTEIDTARRNELAARNSLQTLQDQIRLQTSRRARLESGRDLVTTELEKARLELQRCEVRSPIDGLIVSEHVEQDDYVQKGSVVFTVQDTSSVEVQCRLRMNQMHWLWQSAEQLESAGDMQQAYGFPQTPVKIRYAVGGVNYTWQGTLSSYDGVGIDEQTRMVPVRVFVPDPLAAKSESKPQSDSPTSSLQPRAPALMTGMYVGIEILAKPRIRLLRLPRRAVQPGNTVWVVKDGELTRKRVRPANTDDDNVILYYEDSGLQEGDVVVVSPLVAPTEGTPVHVRDES